MTGVLKPIFDPKIQYARPRPPAVWLAPASGALTDTRDTAAGTASVDLPPLTSWTAFPGPAVVSDPLAKGFYDGGDGYLYCTELRTDLFWRFDKSNPTAGWTALATAPTFTIASGRGFGAPDANGIHTGLIGGDIWANLNYQNPTTDLSWNNKTTGAELGQVSTGYSYYTLSIPSHGIFCTSDGNTNGKVSSFSATTHSLLNQSSAFAGGAASQAWDYHNEHLWVIDGAFTDVRKLSPTMTTLQTVTGGGNGFNDIFMDHRDGQFLYCPAKNGSIRTVNTSTYAINTYTSVFGPLSNYCRGIHVNHYLYLIDGFGAAGIPASYKISIIDTDTMTLVEELSGWSPAHTYSEGFAYDGTYIWMFGQNHDTGTYSPPTLRLETA